MLPGSLNYLHCGDFLSHVGLILNLPYAGRVNKQELLAHLNCNRRASNYLNEVIRCYGIGRSKTLDMAHLFRDANQSILARNSFHRLGCRGFSYSYEQDIVLDGDPLRKNIDFRVALMPTENLFYPHRVKRYLRRITNNHIHADGFPSIAFALGRIEGNDCYVLVLQSDIAYRQAAYVRDHFRGWRKIFVALIESSVRGRCSRLWLCRSCDVVKCCHPKFLPKKDLVPLWDAIYDRTALEMGFVATTAQRPVDLQIYEDLPSVLTQDLYMKVI